MYEVGGAKIWRTRSTNAHKDYLRCLLQAKDLRDKYGLQRVPHGAASETYCKLLNGTMKPAPEKLHLALEDDLMVPAAPAPKTPGMDMDMDENLVADEPLPALDVASASEPSVGSGGGVSDSEQRADFFVRAPHDSDGEKGREASKAPPHAPVPRAFVEKPALSLSMPAFKYGPFHFTRKVAKSGAVSWEATCPFHRKSSRTGCKHTRTVRPATEEESQNVILRLKFWCNEALKFERQRDHLRFVVTESSCPPATLVETMCLPKSAVPDVVATDEELDARDGVTMPTMPDKKTQRQPAVKPKAAKAKAVKAKAKSRAGQGNRMAPSSNSSSISSSSSSSSSPSPSSSGSK